TTGPQAATMPLTQRDIVWRDEFTRLWLAWPGQLRKDEYAPQHNAELEAAAQAHAAELHYRQSELGGIDTSMHIGLPVQPGEEGTTANERALRAGYRLPPGYLAAGNQIESISVDWEGP